VTAPFGLRALATVPNPSLSDRGRAALNAALVILVFATCMAWVRANFVVYDEPGNLMNPYIDVTTYQAAGERLNADHDLYKLGPGDRQVLPWPGRYTAPLLSPPPIAVFWRPLAAVDWGFGVWVAACWLAMIGTLAYLVQRAGLPTLALAFILSHSIGEQLAVGNANAFAPLIYVLAWRWRDRPIAGVLIAALVAVKLAPVVLFAWLLGTRRWRPFAAGVVSLAVIGVVSGLGAGFGSYVEWLGTLSGNTATPLSLSGLTGISWASYAFLSAAGLLALVLGRTRPTLAYEIALVGAVIGTPALYSSSLVGLLALMAPLAETGRTALVWRSHRTTSAALPADVRAAEP